MNQRKLSGSAVGRFLLLLPSDPNWVSTLEFKKFLQTLEGSNKEVEVFWANDFCFIVEDSLSGAFFGHGLFRDWTFLKEIKKSFSSPLSFSVAVRPPETIHCSEGIVLRWKGKAEKIATPSAALSLQEIIEYLNRKSPNLLSSWFLEDVKRSFDEGAYRFRKNSAGEIVYLHLMMSEPDHVRGIYFASELPFAETFSEFYRTHSLANGKEVRAVVMTGNAASLNIHKLAGYEETGKRNFYCEL